MIPQMFYLLESMPTANADSEVIGRIFGAEIHRVFGLDANTGTGVIFILINLAILAFVLSKVLYNPVLKFLGNRTELIQSQLKNAETERVSAIELKVQYEAKIRNIEIERDEILEKARKEAAESSKQVLDEAKAEAEAIRVRALKNVELEEERVKDDMRKSIIDLSSVMAQKFVARTIDANMQDVLFSEVMAELNNADFKDSKVG